MSHITNDAQRIENAAINNCPNHGTRQQYVTLIDEETGERYEEWQTVDFNNCGAMEKVNVGQDRCIRCGRIFTY